MAPVGRGGHYRAIFTATYGEGAATGYKWFAEQGERPLFPFGFGLSTTTFDLSALAVSASGVSVTASVTIRNAGKRGSAAIPQFYVSGPNIPLRLAGWERIGLEPSESRRISISIDPRLMARFDEAAQGWRIEPGAYRLTAGLDSTRRDLARRFELQSVGLPP